MENPKLFATEVLKEVIINEGSDSSKECLTSPDSDVKSADSCAHCSKANAGKRCSKRHAKCLKKFFCDKVCEEMAHRKKDKNASTADENCKKSSSVAAEKASKANKKKAKKAAQSSKPGGQGEFWWNNSVYASW